MAGMDVSILKGGYKSFRRYMQKMIADTRQIIVLGGMTGSGKTEILRGLKKLGEQVVDLEELASHKGSAFGSIGMRRQPTTEQFENFIFDAWAGFDPERPVWIENESRSIGSVFIPEVLFNRMRSARTIHLEVPLSVRIERLVNEYGSSSRKELENAIEKIEKRLGGKRKKEALMALQNDDLESVARLVLEYYDKTYLYGLSLRDQKTVHSFSIEGGHIREAANRLKRLSEKLEEVGA
jgi:tRNA 2-selenouridine synthase